MEVELLNGLQTNYKKKLSFSQEIQGIVEVVAEYIRLIESFFYPITTIFKESDRVKKHEV